MNEVLTPRVWLMLTVVLGTVFALPRLVNNNKSKWPLIAVFIAYVLLNAYFTLLSRGGTQEVVYQPQILRAFRLSFEFDSGILGTIKRFLTEGLPAGISVVSTEPLEGVVINILLYIPMGYLLLAVFPKLRLPLVILIGFLASLLTETIQLAFRLGWFDVDDLLNNTLGTVIGVGLYLLLVKKRIPGKPETGTLPRKPGK